MFSARYLTEVLGVTNYVCPVDIQALRHLEGGLACRFLVVVFNRLGPSQRALLKKIMSSIEVFKYSVLEVREEKILDELLEKTDLFAQFVCIFGGKDFVQEGWLVRKEEQPNRGANTKGSFFQSSYSLEELEDNSLAVRGKKQQLWKQLKLWKSTSRF